ncbi:MAG: MXAN_5187 C-terminal domain-containing protein [Acidobacteriaceae bacterium]
MTVDEEISKLDDNLRRLKIEYDVYFGGGSKKPPADTEWRVANGMKRVGETLKLNYAQRFRFNAIAQRYAVFSDLWRQKMKVREEGYRRPADAQLGISGLRHEEETAAARELRAKKKKHNDTPFSVACSDPAHEPEKVKALFDVMAESQRKHGVTKTSSFASFQSFVQKKTQEIRRQYGCHAVQYSVEVSDGQVKLKAKAKI